MLCETGPLSLLANDVVEYQEDNGTGVFMDPAGGSAQVSLTRVQIYRNTVDGLLANGSTAGSIFAGITDNVSNLNGGSGFKAQGGIGPAVLDVQRSAGNNNGVGGFTADGATAQIFIGNSMATANTTGFNQANGGQIRSYNNSTVDNNSNNGAVTAPQLNPL